ncbi:MAG: hypothetical protein KIT09_11065 [Bryobacteraceae bacterium]|nr:hypothetical protein [Bryobacteraceae bacterium]
MKAGLDKLKEEIEEYLASGNFIVYHSHSRVSEPSPLVHWDSEHYPDFRMFADASKQLEVKLVCFHHRMLDPDFIDNALDDLESVEIPQEEYRRLEERLRELRVYEGFTSLVELSFSYQGQIYIYTRRAEWYEELLDIAEEIDDYLSADEEGDEVDSMGGYFSKN